MVRHMDTSRKGFTVFEVLVVFIIMGIITGWGIPTYTRSIDRARASTAIKNLRLVHAANRMYASNNQGNSCVDLGICDNLDEINTMNGSNSMNLTDGGVTYVCAAGSPDACTATLAGRFRVSVTLDNPLSSGNPSCADLSADLVCP